MFERTAVEAEAVGKVHELIAMANAFGFDRGRLATALPRSWVHDVYSKLETLPDGIDKQAGRRALEKLKRALVRCAATYDRNVPWLQNALRAQAAGNVEHIVAAEPESDSVPDFWSYIASLQPAHSQLVSHDISGFSSVCRRLLECASRAVIVDPYFDLMLPRCHSLFTEMIAWGHLGKCVEFDVYCRAEEVLPKKDNSVQLFEKSVAKTLNAAKMTKSLTVRMHLLDDKKAPIAPMHLRALITELGGISIDYGFRLEQGRQSPVVVLAGDSLETLRRYFYDGQHPYAYAERPFVWERRTDDLSADMSR